MLPPHPRRPHPLGERAARPAASTPPGAPAPAASQHRPPRAAVDLCCGWGDASSRGPLQARSGLRRGQAQRHRLRLGVVAHRPHRRLLRSASVAARCTVAQRSPIFAFIVPHMRVVANLLAKSASRPTLERMWGGGVARRGSRSGGLGDARTDLCTADLAAANPAASPPSPPPPHASHTGRCRIESRLATPQRAGVLDCRVHVLPCIGGV